MISTAKLWERLQALSKSGTSGYFTQDEFNSNLYSAQYSVLSVCCDNYENNSKVSDYLINHIKEVSVTTVTGGRLYADMETSLPDYYRSLALNYISGGVENPSIKIAVNEEGMYLTSAVRKPDLSKGRTLYVIKGGSPVVLPKQSGLSMNFTYCAKPEEAKIVFTTAEDEDNDYLVIDGAETIDINFPEGLFNLFVYYMLEAMGIEQKENLLLEYSQLGLNRTTITDLK